MAVVDQPTRIMTPGDYLAIIKRRKWSLILPACIVFFLAGMAALFLPSIYKSSSTILIEEKQIPDDFIKGTVTTYVEQRLQAINQRIMSYSQLKEIIDRFNLYSELKTRLTDDEIVQKMKQDIVLQPISTETPDKRTGRPTEATIAFTLSYEGRNPAKVLQVANILASLFLEENIRVRSQQTKETAQFLENELNRVKIHLTKMEERIATFKQKHFNELPELLQANMQSLNTIERNMERLNEQLRSLKEREGYLHTQLASIPLSTESQVDQERRTLQQLKLLLIDLKTQYSDKYPDVIKTKAEIEEIEKRLAESDAQPDPQKEDVLPDNPAYITLASQLASTEAEIDSIKRQLKELNNAKSMYERRIAATPNVEKDIKRLITEADSTRTKVTDLMKKLMEAQLAEGLEKEQKGEHFTVIEPARLAERPYKPNRKAILLIGLVLGIGAGVGMASFREFTDRSVRDMDGMVLLGLSPILGLVPEIITRKDKAQRRARRLAWMLVSLVCVAAGAIAFQYYVMDFNIFWAKLMRKIVQLGI